jgi:NAD(P)-dependent dehydrogenase (short-subunit alcohol dehydrogenase family)
VPPKAPTETSSVSEVRKYYFDTLEIDDSAAVLKLNTTAVMLTTFAFLELLDAGNKDDGGLAAGRVKSQVVATGSAGAFFRRGDSFIYNASKAATTHMMKQLATFLVPWDIRANVIAPGCEITFPIPISNPSFRQVLTNHRVSLGHHSRLCQRVRERWGRNAEVLCAATALWKRGGDGGYNSLSGVESGWVFEWECATG